MKIIMLRHNDTVLFPGLEVVRGGDGGGAWAGGDVQDEAGK